MQIFVPSEIKNHEYRVGITPAGVEQLVSDAHELLVERNAGRGAGISDESYAAAGAQVVSTREQGYRQADLVVKVKEPQEEEFPLLRREQLLFCYLHLAASHRLTEALLQAGVTALAYETLQNESGQLPLLVPMSEVAGRMSIQQGAKLLENPQGGRGILLGGVPGTDPAHVTILGAGVVGTEAAKMAAGLGAHVHLLDTNLVRLKSLSELLPANVVPLYSDPQRIRSELALADLVIGAVLIPGARAPHLVHRSDLSRMKKGSVIVDVAVDQGGCFESTRPTTHEHPSYEEEGILHYGVTNIPGAVSRTSTFALCQATLPFVRALAKFGYDQLAEHDPNFRSALNLRDGQLENRAVAESFGLGYREGSASTDLSTSVGH